MKVDRIPEFQGEVDGRSSLMQMTRPFTCIPCPFNVNRIKSRKLSHKTSEPFYNYLLVNDNFE